MDSKIIQQLENVGFNGVLIIALFGVYKLLVSRNFISKCGWISIDFRSKELRQQELEYKHIARMAQLEIEKLQILNNNSNIIEEYDTANKDKSAESQ